MAAIEVFLFMVALGFLLYHLGTKNFRHWKLRGVPGLGPAPFLGDNYDILTRRATPIQAALRYYNAFKGRRFGGLFVFTNPTLLITDLDLIKTVMVKDSDFFINKFNWVNEESDPIFSRNVLVLKDKRWRDMRNTLSPLFTSAKMKNMFTFMDKCSEQVTRYLQMKVQEQVDDGSHADCDVYHLEVKGFFKRYATDVIASTAFGLEVDSLEDPENEFFKMGDHVTNFTGGLRFLKFVFILMFPLFAKVLNVSFFGEKYTKFFQSIIHNSIKERQDKKIVRPDMIHLLMEARNGSLVDETTGEKAERTDLTDEDITAQAMIFFFGGFETISTVMAFLTHELAVNPEVQERLRREVDDQVAADDGVVTYDAVTNRMPYLGMVFNETLRKWPPALLVDRLASQPYTIPESAANGEPALRLERGDSIWISVAGFHYDPQYFPHPEKFDPDRFSDENKRNIVPYSFIPFGLGPRHCIGMRFGILEIKTCVVHLLRSFQIVTVPKTSDPIRLRKDMGMMLGSEDGFWVGFKPRVS